MRAPTSYYYITCGLYETGGKVRPQVTVGTGLRFPKGEHLEFGVECTRNPTVWVWQDPNGKKIFSASTSSKNQELKITGSLAREWIRRFGVHNKSPTEVVEGTGDRAGQTGYRVVEFTPPNLLQAERFRGYEDGGKLNEADKLQETVGAVKRKRDKGWSLLTKEEKFAHVAGLTAAGRSPAEVMSILHISPATFQRFSNKAASPLTREGKRVRMPTAVSKVERVNDLINELCALVIGMPGCDFLAQSWVEGPDGVLFRDFVLKKLS
jgi:hypothetical protein